MNAARPKGLTETSVLMSITNAMGWAIIDWSKRNASHYFHRVHHAHFRGLCGYLVLLERSELGENTCPPNLNSFSVQREWLGPLPDNGTHYDFFGGDAGSFSSLLVEYQGRQSVLSWPSRQSQFGIVQTCRSRFLFLGLMLK